MCCECSTAAWNNIALNQYTGLVRQCIVLTLCDTFGGTAPDAPLSKSSALTAAPAPPRRSMPQAHRGAVNVCRDSEWNLTRGQAHTVLKTLTTSPPDPGWPPPAPPPRQHVAGPTPRLPHPPAVCPASPRRLPRPLQRPKLHILFAARQSRMPRLAAGRCPWLEALPSQRRSRRELLTLRPATASSRRQGAGGGGSAFVVRAAWRAGDG